MKRAQAKGCTRADRTRTKMNMGMMSSIDSSSTWPQDASKAHVFISNCDNVSASMASRGAHPRPELKATSICESAAAARSYVAECSHTSSCRRCFDRGAGVVVSEVVSSVSVHVSAQVLWLGLDPTEASQRLSSLLMKAKSTADNSRKLFAGFALLVDALLLAGERRSTAQVLLGAPRSTGRTSRASNSAASLTEPSIRTFSAYCASSAEWRPS
mmetsp:Transcript_89636/g.254100  ORF Transcript_89636/g.254100 Transcript_89636/m.254100 type:complete len:214 (+) Transcript_89636:202-843(+)